MAKSESSLKADLSAVGSAKAESSDGAWVVRLESPFVQEQPAWMPLRIDLEQIFPHGSSRCDAHLRLARACARQAQRTGSALWKARAEALVGARLSAQFPTTGQIPPVQEVDVALNVTPMVGRSPGAGLTSMCGEYQSSRRRSRRR